MSFKELFRKICVPRKFYLTFLTAAIVLAFIFTLATADSPSDPKRVAFEVVDRNAEQIATSQGKDELKTEIVERLNAFLPGKPINAVYFTDFVVQL